MSRHFDLNTSLTLMILAATTALLHAQPPINKDVVFETNDGLLAIEAEHYFKQTKDETRAWHLTTVDHTPDVTPDGDGNHAEGASGGIYLEILPDTRRNHGDTLTPGVNFSNEPGKMAILHYNVYFNEPGRYYVWARLYSTTTEDNGLHVGLDGRWPEHGQRIQWIAKDQWAWSNKQRTKEKHTGVPYQIWLDIDEPGQHVLTVAMREDGTELDKLVLTKQPKMRPDGTGPEPKVKRGELPSINATQ
jgi:hypothetical protein